VRTLAATSVSASPSGDELASLESIGSRSTPNPSATRSIEVEEASDDHNVENLILPEVLAQAVKVCAGHRRWIEGEFFRVCQHRAVTFAEVGGPPITLEPRYQVVVLRLNAETLRMGIGSIVTTI
jgi:hypothetical protein